MRTPPSRPRLTSHPLNRLCLEDWSREFTVRNGNALMTGRRETIMRPAIAKRKGMGPAVASMSVISLALLASVLPKRRRVECSDATAIRCAPPPSGSGRWRWPGGAH